MYNVMSGRKYGPCEHSSLQVLISEIQIQCVSRDELMCYDMGQNVTIGKIELKPSIVLSSDDTNCRNDIQLFHQLFDELSVYRDYH